MQSFLLRAFSVVACSAVVCAMYTAPASATSGHKMHAGQGAKHHHSVPKQRYVHPASGTSSGGYGPDMPRSRPSTASQPAPTTLTLPLNPAQLPPRQILGISGSHHNYYEPHSYHPAPERRRLEMLSGSPVDPNTILSQLPSGRIVMQAPYYGYRWHAYQRHGRAGLNTHQPYAQPTFHIIGEPSRKHMSKPVKLTYGTEVRQRLNPSPRVVWIKEERQGRQIHVVR
ncbi:MAG: hypothetical protein ACRCWF_12825 [Beijerinckiaceae bacterium]